MPLKFSTAFYYVIGDRKDSFTFFPSYGAPFVMTTDGLQREATMEDYDSFCKLIHTSRYLDMNGWMMVEPFDMPPATMHMDMMLSNMLLCDKPFMDSPVSRKEQMEQKRG